MMRDSGIPMIVECAQCHTKFKIADEKITPRGVKVRCSKCKNMFVVKPDGVEAVPEEPPEEKAEGVPVDISKAPTRVESRPPRVPSSEKQFPLPPPPVPAGAGPGLEDKIGLDFGAPTPAPERLPSKLPEPPPLDQMATMPTRPPPRATPPSPVPAASPFADKPAAAPAKSDLGNSLFGDLSLEQEAKKPLVEPKGPRTAFATKAMPPPPPPPSVAPPPPDDDPFAGIDVSAPPATAGTPPAAEKPPPWAEPASADLKSGEAVGKPTKDLFDGLGDPFAVISSPPAGEAAPPAASGGELMPGGGSGLPAELAGGPPPEKQAAAASPASPGRPQDDIFASAGAPATGGTPSPAEADDPFAGIDTSVPTGMPTARTSGGDAQVGDDPFAQLDSAATAGASEEDEAAISSGLELDSDGQLTGEPLPEPPPPTKSPVPGARPEPVRTAPFAPAPSVPMAAPAPQKAPSAGVLWVYKMGFGLLAVLVALLLFVAYRSGGKPDLTSWSTYVRAFTGEEGVEAVSGDLEVVEVKNTAYTSRKGHSLVVVWGRVGNKTESEKAAVVVSGKLLSEKGRELGKFSAPAGVVFTPQEVFEMEDHQAVASAYRSRLEKVRDLKVPPRGEVPFMLVFHDHPEKMEGVRVRVLPQESQDPLRGLPPEPEPTEEAEASGEGLDRPEAEPSREKPPASAAGVVVKQKGDVVRLKPRKKPRPEEEVEEFYDVPVEVIEEEDEDVE
jgi:predicted Zn finger-like uncharacterized protein